MRICSQKISANRIHTYKHNSQCFFPIQKIANLKKFSFQTKICLDFYRHVYFFLVFFFQSQFFYSPLQCLLGCYFLFLHNFCIINELFVALALLRAKEHFHYFYIDISKRQQSQKKTHSYYFYMLSARPKIYLPKSHCSIINTDILFIYYIY